MRSTGTRTTGTATAQAAAAAALVLCCLACCVDCSPAAAGEQDRAQAVQPGKSLRGIALTGSRAQAVAAVRRRFGSAERRAAPRTYTYAGGYVEDQWELSSGSGGTNLETFAVLSRHGRVVQLRVYTSKPEGSAGGQTFAQLLRRYDLKKRNYVFLEPEGGGGYAGFYYDDVKRGVCFTRGLQDVFLLTYRPDGIIVHRPGAPAVPIEEGLRGRPDHGPQTRAYADEAEARRAQRKDR